MAQITPDTEFAPDESVHYSFPDGEFDLAPGETHETSDSGLIDSAAGHPWLNVEVEAEAVVARYRATQVDPENDPLSAENPVNKAALTVEAAKEFEDSKWIPTEESVVNPPNVVDESVNEDVGMVEDPPAEPEQDVVTLAGDEPEATVFDPFASDNYTTTEDDS